MTTPHSRSQDGRPRQTSLEFAASSGVGDKASMPFPRKPAKHWSTETHSVRERFSLGVIFVVTAYVAVALYVLQLLASPWYLTALCFGLSFFVGAAQLGLRRWERPRIVSVLAGTVYGAGVFALLCFVEDPPMYIPPFIAYAVILVELLLAGGLVGWIAGIVNSSAFLLHDFARDSLRAKQVEREALMAANGEKPRESPFDD